MKKQKSIDSLLDSLENQKGALMRKNQRKSVHHWCGLNITGGAGYGRTGSQMDEAPLPEDWSDLPDPGDDQIASSFGG